MALPLILAPPEPPPRKPGDWHWQARNAVTTVAGLEKALKLTAEERAGAIRAENAGFPISITPHYLSLCDKRDPSCPVRRQCVPTADEAVEVPGDLRAVLIHHVERDVVRAGDVRSFVFGGTPDVDDARGWGRLQ